MNESPTSETRPSEEPRRQGSLLRLPRLSGKATAACLVAFFLATALLIPGVVRLPLWVDVEIVLGVWWLTWLILLTALLYRGQRVTDDHQLARPRSWLNAFLPEPKRDPLDIRKRDRLGWWEWIGYIGPVDGEGCLIVLAILLMLIVAFFALWFVVEIAIPVMVFLLYMIARGMLAAVVNDRHRCRGRLGHALVWGFVWATVYTVPLAGAVWFVHYLLNRQALLA